MLVYNHHDLVRYIYRELEHQPATRRSRLQRHWCDPMPSPARHEVACLYIHTHARVYHL